MLTMPTILIIESNPFFLDTLREIILRKFPELKVTQARDADDGLDKAIRERPQLVLTDLRLNGDIALPMIKVIAQEQPEACIAVLSDTDEEEYRKAVLRQGADVFMSPVGKQVLAIIEARLFG